MTQVIIVGAGVIGLAIAEELTRRGVRVQLFERNPDVGREASGAAAGILAPQSEVEGPGPFLDLLLAGYQLIPEAMARLEALAGLDLKYRATGMLTLALSESDEDALNRDLAWQQPAGLRFEPLSASEVKSLEPAVDGPVRSALWWPQSSQVDNVRLVEAYRKVIEHQGGVVRTQMPVIRFLVERERVVGVETREGKALADWIVNCTGSWAGLDASLPLSIPIFPVKGQILQFRTDRPFVSRIVKSPRAYLVQRSPHQLIVGSTLEKGEFNKAVTPEGRKAILRGVQEITSGVDFLPEETAWAGLRPGTPDGLPILGPSPLQGFLLATGHFRNGILLAPLTGRLVADWITTGSCSLDLSAFSVNRFLARSVVNAVTN